MSCSAFSRNPRSSQVPWCWSRDRAGQPISSRFWYAECMGPVRFTWSSFSQSRLDCGLQILSDVDRGRAGEGRARAAFLPAESGRIHGHEIPDMLFHVEVDLGAGFGAETRGAT